jgi:hypothetical protein
VLETGNWELETGSWKLEAGNWPIIGWDMMRRSRQRSIARGSCRTLAAIAMLCAVTVRVEGFAQDAQVAAVPVLRTVRVVAEASNEPTTVTLEADGPLPAPVTGALDGPPRIYLDLNGVRPGPAMRLAEPGALVFRVRVALHSANPVSTRVVLDLSKPSPYHVDSSGRAQGRLIIVLGASSSASPAAPSAVQNHARTTTPAPATPSPSVSAIPAAPQRRAIGADVYAARVSVALGRLQALRPVLASIDHRAEQPAGDLTVAAAEFDAVARILAAIKPPASREMTHGLLLRTCALGARAVRMRLDSTQTGDSASGWNAASAAAGALIMLDSASTDLGYPPPK